MSEILVGDRIRCSVAFLKELYELPEHRSFLVEVGDIRLEVDGSKVLVLNRIYPETLK